MTHSRVVVPFLLLANACFPPIADAHSAQATTAQPPGNVQVDERLREVVAMLLIKSATFRGQCDVIAGANVRISVVLTLASRSRAVRARTKVGRLAGGLLWAVIDIPPADDYAELLPHEFEHVIEQIEGLDLAAQARTGNEDVFLAADGSFETLRARTVGLIAAGEVHGDGPPVFSATARGVRRALRVLRDRAAEPRAWSVRMRAGVHKEF